MALKKITAQKTKKKRKRKRKRHQNQNANSTGRSYSAPKPVWELLLVRQLQIILGEKLFGPQARLRITPIAWFEPATSMTSLALVARPRLPVDHLEYASLINISCRYREFSNTGLGGEGGGRGGGAGEEVCPNESAIERFRSRIKEMNHTKNWKKWYQRRILAYVVMADGLARWGSLNTTIRTLLKEVINCVHWLSFDLCITVNKRKFVT